MKVPKMTQVILYVEDSGQIKQKHLLRSFTVLSFINYNHKNLKLPRNIRHVVSKNGIKAGKSPNFGLSLETALSTGSCPLSLDSTCESL
jgi:hypothetical protein